MFTARGLEIKKWGQRLYEKELRVRDYMKKRVRDYIEG